MKRLFFLFMMICTYSAIYAQNLTVKSVNLRPQDARAASQPREDKNGKKCAIIRVGVVGVDDLVFPDAVGDVERKLSEYVVYVPDGLKMLQYENKSGKRLGTVVFDKWDVEINSLKSYDVIFDSENHLRSAIFSIQPKHAKLLFNGKNVNADTDGMAMINMPAGEYSYHISANGFESQSGTVMLKEDEISTVTDVVLQEILYPVTINVFPEDATVFIDNVPYTKEAIKDLQLSSGKHSLRVTAANYEDDQRTIDVNANLNPIYCTLKETKQNVVIHKEERTKTRVNIRNAFYLTFGGAATTNYNISFVGFKVDFSFVHHLGGMFAMREGINLSVLGFPIFQGEFEGKKELKEIKDSLVMSDWKIPIQFGISIPFGKYNEHLFSVFAGGYGRWWGGRTDEVEGVDMESLKEKLGDNQFVLTDFYDYGLCASFKLDISKFTIGADVSQSLNDHGLSGAIVLGYKLYTLKKKKKNK